MYDANYVDSLRPIRSYDPRSTTSDPPPVSSFHLPLTTAPSVPYFHHQQSPHHPPPTVMMKSPYYTRATDALIQINLLRSVAKPVYSTYPPYVGMLPTYPFDVPQCPSMQGQHPAHLALKQQHHPRLVRESNLISAYSSLEDSSAINPAAYSLECSSVNPTAYSLEGSSVNPTALRVSPSKQDVRLNTSPLRDNNNPHATKFHIVPPSPQSLNYAHLLQLDSDPITRRVPVDPRIPIDPRVGRSSSNAGQTPHFPAHFNRGSVIQLAGGRLKRVEELHTSDFVESASVSEDLSIDSSTVLHMRENHDHNTVILGFSVGDKNIQVTVEAMLEHPFFVFNQGWSSYSPERTLHRYGLLCQPLLVGDRCVSITQRSVHRNTPPQHPVHTSTDLRNSTPHNKDQPLISPGDFNSNKLHDVTQVHDVRFAHDVKKVREVMAMDKSQSNIVRLSCNFKRKSPASLAADHASSSPGIADGGKSAILNNPSQTVTQTNHRIPSCLIKTPEIVSRVISHGSTASNDTSLSLPQSHTTLPVLPLDAQKDIGTATRLTRKRRSSAPSCITDTFTIKQNTGEILRPSDDVLGQDKFRQFSRYIEVVGVVGSSSPTAPLRCGEEGMSCSRSVEYKRCRMGHD